VFRVISSRTPRSRKTRPTNVNFPPFKFPARSHRGDHCDTTTHHPWTTTGPEKNLLASRPPSKKKSRERGSKETRKGAIFLFFDKNNYRTVTTTTTETRPCHYETLHYSRDIRTQRYHEQRQQSDGLFGQTGMCCGSVGVRILEQMQGIAKEDRFASSDTMPLPPISHLCIESLYRLHCQTTKIV
jgi:hypothetical protein